MTTWKGKRRKAKRPAPKRRESFVRTPRGAKVKPPKLYFKDAKAPKNWPKGQPYGAWYIYHHRKEYSTGFAYDEKNYADADFARFCFGVSIGRKARREQGQITFREMILSGLHFAERNANTKSKLLVLARFRSQAPTWVEFFGKMKLIQYRDLHSEEFQTWYVDKRSSYYLARPEDRRSAANGAVALLRALARFCETYAQDEETGWYPQIKIPDGESIAPGPFFTRSEQAAMLLACRGWKKDRKTGEWMTKTYVDENGVTRTTRRVLSRHIIANRKGKSRFIQLGVRTGAREQDLMSVVWGVAKHTSFVDVDDTGAGYFHRRGTEELETNKSRPSNPVPDRLKCLLRIWKKADGQSERVTERDRANGTVRKKHRYLIRKGNNRHYKRLTLDGIVRDAGLPANYTAHGLRRTAVEEAHLQCWSLATATCLIGMTAKVLLDFYTDWNERARRSEDQALREANAPVNNTALRAVVYAPEEEGDRARDRKRLAARLAVEREELSGGSQPASISTVEEAAAEEALRAGNRRLSAYRLRGNSAWDSDEAPLVPATGAEPTDVATTSQTAEAS